MADHRGGLARTSGDPPRSRFEARMGEAGRPQLHALTGLRFVAAFQVLAYHGLAPGPDASWWMRSLVGSGYVGVSLFFVLSGFVLTYTYHDSLRDGTATRREFLAARVARIYPVYLLSLLVALPPLFWLMASKRITPPTAWLAQMIGAYAGLAQAWDPRKACVMNCPAWSLSDEAFFYIAFLFVLPIVARWGVRRLLAAAVAAYALSLLVPGLYLALQPDGAVAATPLSLGRWLAVVKYNPLVRLPEFVMGVLAGRLFLLEGGAPRRWHARLEVGAALALGVLLMCSVWIPYPLLHNGLLAPVFAALVYALARGTGPLARVLSARVLVRLGAASFALYILHVPLLVWLTRGYRVLGMTPPAQPWYFVIFAIVGIAVSLLVFATVEEPGRRFLRRRLTRPRAERRMPAGAGEHVEVAA
jgi:peptidoglycan/LPS O-acetylase OafA/YrhL